MQAEHPHWQGIPGFECTPGGRWFLAWFTGGPREPHPENVVLVAHSDDEGQTFSEPVAIGAPHEDGTRGFDPTLWTDPRGRLWLWFNRGNRQQARHDVRARICDAPAAAAPAFGEEFRMDLDTPYAFRMNKPIVLSSGEWVLPVTHAAEPIHDWFAGPKQRQGVAISTDEGRIWALHGAVEAPDWALENMVVELKDGRLRMLIRTGAGVLWESVSADRGRTWSEGSATAIANPGSRFFIRRLASGNLLLVNHHRFTERSHLTAQGSKDDGQTWSEGLLLDERNGVSYPDGVQTQNGTIHIVYDRDRSGDGDILLARFREEDLWAGEDVSGTLRRKQVLQSLTTGRTACPVVERTVADRPGSSRGQFVSEALTPVDGAFDPTSMAQGEPGVPWCFQWRGERHRVARVLETWKTTGPCRHGSAEQYVRRHWFRVETTDGTEMELYFDRQPHARQHKRRWWLAVIKRPQTE